MTGNQVPATSPLQGLSKKKGLHLTNQSNVLQQVEKFVFHVRDGDPCIGAVPGVTGLYMAAGHSCWGILQVLEILMLLKKLISFQKGPATGEALAHLILEGKVETVDITPFDPARSV